jgi:hypothetical protein
VAGTTKAALIKAGLARRSHSIDEFWQRTNRGTGTLRVVEDPLTKTQCVRVLLARVDIPAGGIVMCLRHP